MSRLALLAAAFALAHAAEHIVLAPISNDTNLPEKALLYMHGGAVENRFYIETATAIQRAATSIRLWVILPATFANLCIISCPFRYGCFPLKWAVDNALQKAVDAGWNRGNDSENLFIAGHSLGGVCAEALLTYYDTGSSPPYAGIIYQASYPGSVGYGFDDLPVPFLVQKGELDGLSTGTVVGTVPDWQRHLAQVESLGFDAAVQEKLVVVLPGVNHSNWCPGFDVPKDLMADVDQAVALNRIGESTAAFLNLHLAAKGWRRDEAFASLVGERTWTSQLLSPYLRALEMETGAEPDFQSEFSIAVQRNLSGLAQDEADALAVTDINGDSLRAFQECAPEKDSNAAVVTCSYGKVKGEEMLVKINMLEQDSASCSEGNELAERIAKAIAPSSTLARYEVRGRRWCVSEEADLARSIDGGLEISEDDECIRIRSPGVLTSGVQLDCALATPAKALAWMYTDSLRPEPLPVENNLRRYILIGVGVSAVLILCVCACASCKGRSRRSSLEVELEDPAAAA